MNKKTYIIIAAALFLSVLLTSYIIAYSDSDALTFATLDEAVGQRDTIPQTDTTAQRILLIGDSMTYLLGFRMNDYCQFNGHKMWMVSWVSASTVCFGITDTLKRYIEKFKPTYIVFVIGSNELFTSGIKKTHGKYVERIMKHTKGIPCIWVGPPNWKNDTGINDLILQYVGYRRYFPSKNLKFERQPNDVAHPTRRSAAMWMDSIASFISHRSLYPIRMKKPDKSSEEKFPVIVLKPLLFEKDTLSDKI